MKELLERKQRTLLEWMMSELEDICGEAKEPTTGMLDYRRRTEIQPKIESTWHWKSRWGQPLSTMSWTDDVYIL